MAEQVKKKRGRPRKRSAAEEAAEVEERQAATESAAHRQILMDMDLLRLTSRANPFRHPVMKRKHTWDLIATDMNGLFDDEDFTDRRCRERVKVLMTARRAAVVAAAAQDNTEGGAEARTEADIVLDTLIELEDLSPKDLGVEKEMRRPNKLKRAYPAKRRIRTIDSLYDTDTAGEPEVELNGLPALKRPTPEIVYPPSLYETLSIEPVDEFVEGKKAQEARELEIKLEIHRETMADKADERKLRRELLEFDREKLRVEELDRARRFELEKEERTRQFELMRDVLLSRNQ